MAVISLLPVPPDNRGCDGGGIEECPLDAVGVDPVLPPLGVGATLELEDLLIAALISASEDCSPPASKVETSRCNGDECTGEVDFLLMLSAPPPREEFRGETLPVYTDWLVQKPT